ncbi:MAG: [Fe-Fe] hydrogenase large subunit C-terminal domain-containing protein [Candidatus Pacearchaeota archaeon]|jgi:iron only hydrogenase large subunit-like protein
MLKELNANNFFEKTKLKDKEIKVVAMLAPSFAAEFDYPKIISILKSFGVDKVVELTFGAKMINRYYHKQLEANKKSKKLIISSVCPGIVFTIKQKYPKLVKNLILVDSPMIAMAKICKKTFPKHKVLFISPCNFKKLEAENSKYVDFVINYQELHKLIEKNKTTLKADGCVSWDKFYNDYTKIYPLSGGLSKTAHLRGIINKNEVMIIDGINNLEEFLKKTKQRVRFLDVTFCRGGCIGGPYLSKNTSLAERKKRLMTYMQVAKKEKIPECRKGEIKEAKGISFAKTKF